VHSRWPQFVRCLIQNTIWHSSARKCILYRIYVDNNYYDEEMAQFSTCINLIYRKIISVLMPSQVTKALHTE
jgi:hypothetical protein